MAEHQSRYGGQGRCHSTVDGRRQGDKPVSRKAEDAAHQGFKEKGFVRGKIMKENHGPEPRQSMKHETERREKASPVCNQHNIRAKPSEPQGGPDPCQRIVEDKASILREAGGRGSCCTAAENEAGIERAESHVKRLVARNRECTGEFGAEMGNAPPQRRKGADEGDLQLLQ